MSRHFFLFPLCTSMFTAVFALDNSDIKGLSITVDTINYASQQFSVGYTGDKWSSGNRYELNGMAQFDEGKVQPSGGMYLFYEDRNWKGKTFTGSNKNQETASLTCLGLGLQGGATVNLVPQQRNLWLALVPYLRGGIGYQDFLAKDVIIDNAQYNLSGGSSRVEVAAGVDLRLTVAKKIEVVFGGGVDYWSAASVALYAGTNGGGAAIGSNGAFTGTDAWVRFGAGLHF